MTIQLNTFKQLHDQHSPLLLGNVWDVTSAQLFEKLGFQALGTSSAAAASLLGYEDGEGMPFDEYLMIVQRIAANTPLPLTVDIEAGYGQEAETAVNNIQRLTQLGVVGINLEDSIFKNSARSLVDAQVFAYKLQQIFNGLKCKSIDVFINLRIDTFLLQVPNVLEETKRRIDLYQDFIDGVFLPCIANEEDIQKVTQHTSLPLNVMTVPYLPDFERLKNLGVKRISTGNFLHGFMYNQLNDKMKSILKNQSFRALFEEG